MKSCFGRSDAWNATVYQGRGNQCLDPIWLRFPWIPPLGTIPAMWNHALDMEGRMKQNEIVWPRFVGTDMADLQAYLRAQRSSP